MSAISTGVGLAIAGTVGAAGAIGGSLISSNAAKSASQTQANSADKAAALLTPYRDVGTANLQKLDNLAPFAAPTADQARATPGYQFAVQQGNLAMQSKLVAGGISGGNAAEALTQYNQGLADTNYNTTYNQALSTYDANSSHLAQLANMGLGAAGQQGQDFMQAGNATAAGTVGAANAWNSGISGATGSITNSLLLNSILGQNQNNSSNTSSYTPPVRGYVSPEQQSAYNQGSVPVGQFAPPSYNFTNLSTGV